VCTENQIRVDRTITSHAILGGLHRHYAAKGQKRIHALQQTASSFDHSSVRASSVGGTVSPSALAVLRLMTRSNFVGCATGFWLLRMRPA
jgi:hypothetical protein